MKERYLREQWNTEALVINYFSISSIVRFSVYLYVCIFHLEENSIYTFNLVMSYLK